MFAAYERFIDGEMLANGRYVELGTDLLGGDRIALEDPVGHLRVWGVRDTATGRTLLWIDNADHTWSNVANRIPVPPASALIRVAGMPSSAYQVERWDPYARDPSKQILGVDTVTAADDGAVSLAVEGLETDLAIKILPARAADRDL
jgi:hypothetical protein